MLSGLSQSLAEGAEERALLLFPFLVTGPTCTGSDGISVASVLVVGAATVLVIEAGVACASTGRGVAMPVQGAEWPVPVWAGDKQPT